MSKSNPIKYKETLAMPGSELYKLLSEGKDKEAEKSYQATKKRHKELMAQIEEKFPSKNSSNTD